MDLSHRNSAATKNDPAGNAPVANSIGDIEEFVNPVAPAGLIDIDTSSYPGGLLDNQVTPAGRLGDDNSHWEEDESEPTGSKTVGDPMIEARVKAAGRAVRMPYKYVDPANKTGDKKVDTRAHDEEIVRWNSELIASESVDGRFAMNCIGLSGDGLTNPSVLGVIGDDDFRKGED